MGPWYQPSRHVSRHAEHEHLVTVFGSFVVDDPDGTVVLAMELAEQSLQDSLSAGGRPSVRTKIDLRGLTPCS